MSTHQRMKIGTFWVKNRSIDCVEIHCRKMRSTSSSSSSSIVSTTDRKRRNKCRSFFNSNGPSQKRGWENSNKHRKMTLFVARATFIQRRRRQRRRQCRQWPFRRRCPLWMLRTSDAFWSRGVKRLCCCFVDSNSNDGDDDKRRFGKLDVENSIQSVGSSNNNNINNKNNINNHNGIVSTVTWNDFHGWWSSDEKLNEWMATSTRTQIDILFEMK